MYDVKDFGGDAPLVETFHHFTAALYEGDPFRNGRETTLTRDMKTRYFLVYRDGTVAGRACGIVNPGIKYQNKRTGLIGYYECEDDIKAAGVLLNTVTSYFREKGFEYLIGPIDGSTWYPYRTTVPDHKKPFFLDNYHKNWYAGQFSGNGFSVISKYYSSRVSCLERDYRRVEKFERRFADRGIVIRGINRQDFEVDMKKIYSVCMESFRHNFLYTPIGFEEFLGMYKKVKNAVDPRWVLMAEGQDGTLLGFIFAMHNLFEKKKKSAIIKTVAVKPGSRSRGLGTLLVEKIHQTAFRNGYDEVIHALMHEQNQSVNIAQDHTEAFRAYLLFGKTLTCEPSQKY